MGWSGNLHGKRRSVSNTIGVTRREALAFTAAGLAAAAAPGVGRAAGPQGQLIWGVHTYFAGADLVRPGRDAGDHYPVHGDVRAARRGGEADARKSAGAVPGRVVFGV